MTHVLNKFCVCSVLGTRQTRMGSGPIGQLLGVRCSGQEQRLIDCPNGGITDAGCYSQGGVQCISDFPEG